MPKLRFTKNRDNIDKKCICYLYCRVIYDVYCRVKLVFGVHLRLEFLDFLVVDVVVVIHELVDSSLRCELNDSVGYGLDKLVVVAREEYIALEANEVVVECLNTLEVKVVGRGIENQAGWRS